MRVTYLDRLIVNAHRTWHQELNPHHPTPNGDSWAGRKSKFLSVSSVIPRKKSDLSLTASQALCTAAARDSVRTGCGMPVLLNPLVHSQFPQTALFHPENSSSPIRNNRLKHARIQSMTPTLTIFAALLLIASTAHSHEPVAPAPRDNGLKVLVYSNTEFFVPGFCCVAIRIDRATRADPVVRV